VRYHSRHILLGLRRGTAVPGAAKAVVAKVRLLWCTAKQWGSTLLPSTHWEGSAACGALVLWPQCMSCSLRAKVTAQGQPAGLLSATAAIFFAQPRRSPASPAASPTARAPLAVPPTRALCTLGATTCPH
jgi:hypothetical protein